MSYRMLHPESIYPHAEPSAWLGWCADIEPAAKPGSRKCPAHAGNERSHEGNAYVGIAVACGLCFPFWTGLAVIGIILVR